MARIGIGPRPIFAAILVCIGYYLGAKLGFALTLRPRPVSTLWPPNSILLAALLLTPLRSWWLLVLAAFPAHWAAQLQSNVPLPMMFCWFISNSFEALFGAICIRYLVGGKLQFESIRNVGIFMICGVFLGPFLSSFLDSAFVRMNGWGGASYWEVWRTRFFSNALAALVIVTVIVSWVRIRIASIRRAPYWRLAEGAVMMLGLLSTAFMVFVYSPAGPEREPVLLYSPLPFLLWAAVRFGFSGASISILAVALLAISGTAQGHGPFASRSPLENALSVQVFLIVVSIPLLCLAVLLRERRQADAALRSSEARYREVVETQTDLICRFLPDTTLTFVNEAYCRFFDRSREQLIGTKFTQLLPEAARDAALNHIASLIKNPRVEAVEHEVLLRDGSSAWHHWVNHAISGLDGQVIEFQAIGRDISDRKRAEAANEKLTHVSRLAMVGELTASIAHELSQPLSAILSNTAAAEMLLEANSSDVADVKQILADIRKDDVRASEVIRHIRTLFRKRQLEIEALDINELASDTLTFVAIEARQRNVAWKSELTPRLPFVKGDRVQLQQVLLNLVLNAMDAMRDTPWTERRLIVSSGKEEGHVKVSVSDAGHGIPADRLPRLFESFFTTKKEGMGLGLSISRAIIEAHHGRMWGTNNVGGGATFGFLLPVIARQETGQSF